MKHGQALDYVVESVWCCSHCSERVFQCRFKKNLHQQMFFGLKMLSGGLNPQHGWL
jgi:hypothetical protein